MKLLKEISKLMKELQKFGSFKKFGKLPLWERLFYLSFGTLLLVVLVNKANSVLGIKEGFEQTGEFVVKKGAVEIYDEFYVSIYDDLVYHTGKNNCEMNIIKKMTTLDENSRVLDIGSGTGHHVSLFNETTKNVEGMDISPAMVSKAKENYPECNYREEDANNTMAVQGQSMTHITCLYFTIYYIDNKKAVLKNCYDWLMPGGYFIVHLVDRDKFDPILPAGDPFKLVSPQKYAKERITSTVVKFDGYDYKSNFEMVPNEPIAIMNEEFKNRNDGSIRKNEHKIHMPLQKDIISMAKDIGFVMLDYDELAECGYMNQFIYVLRKPE